MTSQAWPHWRNKKKWLGSRPNPPENTLYAGMRAPLRLSPSLETLRALKYFSRSTWLTMTSRRHLTDAARYRWDCVKTDSAESFWLGIAGSQFCWRGFMLQSSPLWLVSCLLIIRGAFKWQSNDVWKPICKPSKYAHLSAWRLPYYSLLVVVAVAAETNGESLYRKRKTSWT